MATTRPVLNGNNLQLILAGLDLLSDQHASMAEEFARSSDFETAGMELSVVADISDLRERMLDLLNGLMDEAMSDAVAELQAEDDGYVTDDVDVDEVGTIPMDELA